MEKQSKTIKNKLGFTLIELLVVIAIIGLLSSIVLASLNSAKTKAQNSARLQEVKQLVNALYLYRNDNQGSYPPPNSGSYIGICPPTGCWLFGTNIPTNTTFNNTMKSYFPAVNSPADSKTIMIASQETTEGVFYTKWCDTTYGVPGPLNTCSRWAAEIYWTVDGNKEEQCPSIQDSDSINQIAYRFTTDGTHTVCGIDLVE